MWYIFICHPHLTSIICCTAVWAQACGLERETSFVIIVHLWFIRRPRSFSVVVGVLVGSSFSIEILSILCKTLRRKIHTGNEETVWGLAVISH